MTQSGVHITWGFVSARLTSVSRDFSSLLGFGCQPDISLLIISKSLYLQFFIRLQFQPTDYIRRAEHKALFVTCKLKMTQRLLFIFSFISTVTFGQPKLTEKFVNDSYNENNYLIFSPDSTFKYRLAYHLFHDISCGQYKTVNDTVFLSYQSDLRDTFCNKEVDAAIHFDSNLFALRPSKLFYKEDKLYKIDKGQVVYRTEKFEPDWEIPKSSRKYYHRKYWLFGPLVSNTQRTYYMVAISKAKWTKASR